MQLNVEDQKPKNSFFQLFNQTHAIIVIILSIFIFLKDYDYKYSEEIENNHLLTPIFDFKVINSSDTCTNEISLGKWLGINEGCYHKSTGQIIEGLCNTINNNDYINIPKQDPIELKSYKGKKFCKGNVPEDLSTYEKIFSKSKFICDASEKDCGIIDSLGRHLCLNHGEKCPLHFLSFSKTNAEPDICQEQCEKVEFNDGTFLFYSDKITDLEKFNNNYTKVIVGFNISDSFPCLEVNKIPSIINYPLEKYVGKCSKPIDEVREAEDIFKYFYLDNINKNQLYIENYVNATSLEGYPDISNINTKIYGINYIGFKGKKLDKVLKSGISLKNLNLTKKGKNYLKIYLIVNIIKILSEIFFFLCLKLRSDISAIRKIKEDKTCADFILLIARIVSFILALIGFIRFNGVILLYRYLEYPYYSLVRMEYDYYYISWILYLIIVVLGISLLGVIILGIFCAASFFGILVLLSPVKQNIKKENKNESGEEMKNISVSGSGDESISEFRKFSSNY